MSAVGTNQNLPGMGAPGRRTVYSMCGMCAVRCPIEVIVEDGKPVWLQGNHNDPSIGTSLCAKGAAGISFEYDDERPQSPLIRKGPRGSGQWKRATWDEALDYITEKLQETVETYGGKGIALSDRGGHFTDLTRTFVSALGSPNYFNHDATCNGNAHNAGKSTVGFGVAGLIPDLKNIKHIVLYGRNIVESLMVKEAKAFMAAVNAGMKVTYIDPRASITACKATRYWQVRPNSDYALNLALLHEILKQELYDKEFVARNVTGMDYLRNAVKDTTPEWQAQHTGIPAGQIYDFVKEIAADAPNVVFHPGWMSARHKQSFHVSRSAVILNALMGNIDIPGGLIIAKSPEFYGRKGLKRLIDRVPKVTEPRVDGAGTERPSWDASIGMLHQLFSALESGKPYGMGAYFAYRHDPITSMPDSEAMKHALDKLKLLVSIDVRYSETGWFSDVILPESTSLLTAGKEEPVALALERMLAMRAYMRAKTIDGVIDETIAKRVGLTGAHIEDMYQIMAIANYEDRFVIPTAHREVDEDAYDLRGSCGFSFGNGCAGGTSETNLFGTPKRAKTPMEVA